MRSAVQLTLLVWTVNSCTGIDIAIIGGGISGTSAAYFLSQLLDEQVQLDIYEGGTIGGRLSTVRVDGCEYETGGAIIHARNKYATDLAKKMGLKKTPDDPNEILGLMNGKDYPFIGSKYTVVNMAKMMWRYGWDLVSLHRYTNDLLSKFDKVYEIQDKNESFAQLNEFMSAIDPVLLSYMNESTTEGFRRDGFSPRIIDELILATLKCNYGQTTTVHRFVGSVSVAGAGYDLFALEGGNKMLPHNLLEASGAQLFTEFVQSVALQSDPAKRKFRVKTETGRSKSYDFVVIGTPLTADPARPQKLRFHGFPEDITVPGRYWRTIATIVKGQINPKYFGFDAPEDVPDLIISISDSTPFNSIGKIRPVADQHTCDDGHIPVWKIFSTKPLTDIKSMFEDIAFLEQIDWLAYPNYGTTRSNYNFTLYEDLFYTNAMEWSASAIETSIIGARNVALLIKKRLSGTAEYSSLSDSYAEYSAVHDEV